MSRRTSEASKAVRAAWQREQELVSEGRGTRDWTPEQQKEILELGKAYYHSEDPNDVNDGKAFEGHHMKSAEAFPEYQGDPDNIQFLSRPEHQEAHGGDYRKLTNGYFDPVTKTMRNFGNNKYEPCEIIALANPIASMKTVDKLQSEKKEESTKEAKEKSRREEKWKDGSPSKTISLPIASAEKPHSEVSKGFGERIMGAITAVKGFRERHPVLTRALEVAIAAGTVAIANSSRGSGGGSRFSSLTDHFSSSSGNDFSDSLDIDDYDDSAESKDYLAVRSSPEVHTVRAHKQSYHTKDGIIYKEKRSYPRGGKHEDG